MNLPLVGHVDSRFQAVRDVFIENFAERGEVGAGVCVIVRGDIVIDLGGGWADEAQTRPWQLDQLVNFYSVGKAIVGLLALQLVDSGAISLDDPISSIWPEFAVGGKAGATVRHALSHQAGVPAIREALSDDDLWDWRRMTEALARTEAWFEPGSRLTYHTNTYGHLVGEIIRRVSGEMPGDRLRSVAQSAGADIWFGVPESELPRCADVIWAPASAMVPIDLSQLTGEGLMIASGYFNPPGYSSTGVVNTREWRKAQIPSTNGHGSARGVASLYAALLEPGRLLSPELLEEATRPQIEGFCPVLGEETQFGLGFKPTVPRRPFGPNPRAFGHFGTGGAVGFADPDAGVAFGYVMNHVIPRWQSSRNRSLVDAVYSSL